MAEVVFAKAFRRHVECPDGEVAGSTVGEVLAGYFERHPAVRSYVLGDPATHRLRPVLLSLVSVTAPWL